MHQSVRELTRAIASGDTDAFAQLYDANFDAMVHDAKRYTGRDESFCLDVVHDAMLKVIRAIKPMDTHDDLRAWLRCVVKSCAYDSLRRESRRRKREQRTPEPSMDERSDELAERLQWLRDELASLDPASRDLVLLRHRLGWTLQRIGRTVGLNPGAVDGRLTRIMRKLKSRAEQFDE